MQYVAVVTKEGKNRLVEFPDAPGCQTFAEPGENLAELARDALVGWLESYLAAGDVPPARARTATEGDLVVVVPPALAMKVLIRQARAAAGLTQAALAKRAGLTQAMVSRLEDPDHGQSFETVIKAAEALALEIVVEGRARARIDVVQRQAKVVVIRSKKSVAQVANQLSTFGKRSRGAPKTTATSKTAGRAGRP